MKIGRAVGKTSNQETPDKIGRVGISGFSTIFLLYSAVPRLNNQGLESRLRLGIRTNSIKKTSFQIKMGVSSYFQVILSRSLFSNLFPRVLFPGLFPQQGKSALGTRLFG